MRHRRRLAQAFLLVLFASGAHAQRQIILDLKSLPLKAPPYELIQFVSEGEAYGPVSQQVRGRVQRLVVLRPAIGYDRPVFRLETLTYGDEGCCIKLVGARELPIEQFTEYGVALPNATTSEFKLIRWLSPRAIEFRYGQLVCTLGGLGKPQSTLACTQ